VTSEEQRAENEATFRDANELIRETQKKLGISDGLVPFLCECEDAGCRHVVRLTPDAYEAIRAHPTRFLVADGHPTDGRVVERHDGYIVTEKHGRSGEVAAATDPRGEG
jgi:hypothetical protein